MRENIEVSIKKETKKLQKQPQLKTEAKIYQSLLNINSQDITGVKALAQDEVQGVPHFYGMGELPDSYYLIIEFLGPNLIELFNYCGYHKFTISTVSLIALQMINRIEYIHKHHYIHRDIKPENFLIGIHDKSNMIYLIDFGLSKRYKNPKTHQHIPYREGRALTGTARYVSINTHLGIEQSRRDDLESIFYILIYFLKGSLPWQGLKVNKKEDRHKKIYEIKKNIQIKELCSRLPQEFELFYNYIKKLQFEQVPDYYYLKILLKNILEKNNYIIDFDYDWNKEKVHIEKDNIIFKNNYNIKYNGKEEWLIRKEDSNLDHNSNEIIYNNNNNPNRNNNITNKIYYKPVIPLKHQIYKKSKSSFIFNNNQPPRTAENSYNDSKYFESNYTTSKKNI
jgi:serine/threonine protein kinase